MSSESILINPHHQLSAQPQPFINHGIIMIQSKAWPYETAIQMRDYMFDSLRKHCHIPSTAIKGGSFLNSHSNALQVTQRAFAIPVAVTDDESVRTLEEMILDKIYWTVPETSYWIRHTNEIALNIYDCTVLSMSGIQIVALCKRIDSIGVRRVEMLWIDHRSKSATQFSQYTCTEVYRRTGAHELKISDMRIYNQINLSSHFGVVHGNDGVYVDIDSDPFITHGQDMLWKDLVDIANDFKSWAKLDPSEVQLLVSQYLLGCVDHTTKPETNSIAYKRVHQFLERRLHGSTSPLYHLFDQLHLSVLWENQATPDFTLTSL